MWLRFGAVDWRADVWVNGRKVAEHEGGYTPFEADISDVVNRDGENVVVVRAFDATDAALPTGKQVGWYTPSSGIWQTVWLEARPKTYIADFRIVTGIAPAKVAVKADIAGVDRTKYQIALKSKDPTVQRVSKTFEATTPASGAAPGEKPAFSVGLESVVEDAKLWTPETPELYDATLELKDEGGKVIDSVETYFGLRTIGRGRYGEEPFERILLNGKPIYLRAALDQSFNPKGLYTAPDDDFLKRDMIIAKTMGLNGLRIHIKPDEPRRLYWADHLGILILQDMPNTWRQNSGARQAWEKTMREAVARDRNHPAIFAWVAFNETWGLGKPEEYKKDRDTQAWVAQRLQVPLAEVGDGAKIRRIEPDNAQEVDPFARRLGDPARRVDAVAIAVQQQRRHHRRVKRRLPALARIRGFDLTKVERLEHKRQNEASQMVLADKVLNARRQQQRLIDRPGPEGLAHKQTQSNSSKRRQQNPLLSRQAPSPKCDRFRPRPRSRRTEERRFHQLHPRVDRNPRASRRLRRPIPRSATPPARPVRRRPKAPSRAAYGRFSPFDSNERSD